MYDIQKRYPKKCTKKEARRDPSIKKIENKFAMVIIFLSAYLFIPLYILKESWEAGDGFFSTIFYLTIGVVTYLVGLFLGSILYDDFNIKDKLTTYIDERKIDKSFFTRDTVLLDTNIFMAAGEEYDKLFSYFIKHRIKITILGSVFDELTKIKSEKGYQKKHNIKNAKGYKKTPNDINQRYKSASTGLGRISRLQDFNLAIITDIDIQTKKYVYADPDIINFAKDHKNKSILIISNDLDVKLRADKFINSSKSIAILGKDIVNLI